MTNKLEKAINEVLSRRNITDYFELLDEIKKVSNSKKGDDFIEEMLVEFLLNAGVTDIIINVEGSRVIYREKLFANTSFRIQLTVQELTEKMMVIGHRLMPFIHPKIHPKNILLIDEADNEIHIKEIKCGFIDALIWFSLLPPYGFQHYELDDENQIKMYIYDLKDWMAANHFELEDNLLISPIDYAKNVFRIKKINRREIAEQQILNTNKDKQLTQKLGEAIFSEEVMLPIDMQLFKAFAYTSEQLIQNPGSPLGPFLSNNEELNIFNNGDYAYLNSKAHFNEMAAMAFDEAMMPNMEEMGKAEDLEGIFNEMGISFSRDFVSAKLVEQMHERKQTDQDELTNILFEKGEMPFYNEQQEQNFKEALSQLAQQIEAEWGSHSLGLPLKNLLTKSINLKVEIIALLRTIDKKIEDPENFNFEFLMHLQPFEILTDQMLENILNDREAFNPKMTNQLSKQVDQMRTEFSKVKNQILDNL